MQVTRFMLSPIEQLAVTLFEMETIIDNDTVTEPNNTLDLLWKATQEIGPIFMHVINESPMCKAYLGLD